VVIEHACPAHGRQTQRLTRAVRDIARAPSEDRGHESTKRKSGGNLRTGGDAAAHVSGQAGGRAFEVALLGGRLVVRRAADGSRRGRQSVPG